MRRRYRNGLGLILAGILLGSLSSPAIAQSFLQNFFSNIFGSAPAEPKSRTNVERSPSPFGPGASGHSPYNSMKPRSGRYRTVCVRMCDGYYFPIRHEARRRDFHKDAKACSNRCGGGRLYYLDSNSDNTAAMVDLTGRRYDQLDTAFLYRKTLINGCSCRPMPWTAAERARHSRYRYEEDLRRLNEERERRVRQAALEKRKSLAEHNTSATSGQPSLEASNEDAGQAGPDTTVAWAATVSTEVALTAVAPENVEEAITNEQAAPEEAPTVNISSQQKQRRPAKRKRKRRTKSVSQQTQPSWSPFAGASQYSWPGDR